MLEVKCPQCGKPVDFNTSEFRPFCSERCRTLDLGAWASEEYAVPTGENELTEDDLRLIEQSHLQRSKND